MSLIIHDHGHDITDAIGYMDMNLICLATGRYETDSFRHSMLSLGENIHQVVGHVVLRYNLDQVFYVPGAIIFSVRPTI